MSKRVRVQTSFFSTFSLCFNVEPENKLSSEFEVLELLLFDSSEK